MDQTAIKEFLETTALDMLPDLLMALAILVIGFWLAGRVKRFIISYFGKSEKLDKTLVVFFGGFSKILIIIMTLLIVLETFGVKTTSFLAVFGAAGLAIGLSLQGTLSNIASGVMLLIFRPFKVGDFINVAGQEGTVSTLSLFVTEIDTPDNKRIFVPNNAVWGSSIVNVSYHKTRRAQMIFGIAYDADVEKAMGIINKIVTSDERVLKDPEPTLVVAALNDCSVDLMVRFWTEKADLFGAQWDVTKQVKQGFDAAGIEIPFPTRTVYERK